MDTGMKLLSKVNELLMALIKWSAIGLFVVMLFSASWQIIMRFVFKSPLAWTDEVAKFAFVWSTMLGCAYLVRTKGHSSVEMMAGYLKGVASRLHATIIDLFCLLVYVIIVTGGISMMQAGATSVSPACGLPMAAVYAIVPFSGVLMSLFQLEILLDDLRKIRKKEVA